MKAETPRAPSVPSADVKTTLRVGPPEPLRRASLERAIKWLESQARKEHRLKRYSPVEKPTIIGDELSSRQQGLMQSGFSGLESTQQLISLLKELYTLGDMRRTGGLAALLHECKIQNLSEDETASRIDSYYLMHGIQLGSEFNESAAIAPSVAQFPNKPIYAESDKSRDPVTFYREEWADEIANGTITQALVRSVDPGLIKTMRQFCVRRHLNASSVLPPPAGGPHQRPGPDAEQAIAMVQNRRKRERERIAAKRAR